ncbi:putative quinol monooxygenase [Pontivivens insulae]|uniref:ABM domain-containing protein n=1 Tax=Pontivivens insulae TaxID=1639689 RepID=A0A2R8AAA8_9RHOB|nr:antibiotic biosynthesis monooxygenase [Pontivivens insulae]RED13047.1 antibiotic biosynthesis monooxygenase [Pontivivens insulae]SPF29139.1 hypothetical protein POI8812_01445 [Pontivivens insulae]
MIIVAGEIDVKPGQRDAFIEGSLDAVRAARAHPDCQIFSVAPDPIEADRVTILEQWSSMDALDAFRADGPENSLTSLITAARVRQHELGQTTLD